MLSVATGEGRSWISDFLLVLICLVMYSEFGVGEGQTVYGFRMCNYETPSMHHQLPLSTVLLSYEWRLLHSFWIWVHLNPVFHGFDLRRVSIWILTAWKVLGFKCDIIIIGLKPRALGDATTVSRQFVTLPVERNYNLDLTHKPIPPVNTAWDFH